jgi:hypothetical protein
VTARPIGEILALIISRTHAMAGFQQMLANVDAAVDRKALILASYEAGAISDRDARLLIETYQLETA